MAYNILAIAMQRLNTYEPDTNEVNVRAKKLLVKCANTIIAAQELSAQQVSSYLLGHGDCYTSHQFKEIYWRCYDGFVKHCIPDRGYDHDPVVDSCLNEMPTIDNSVQDRDNDIEIVPAAQTDDEDPSLCGLLSNPVIGIDDCITAVFDKGNLAPKASFVADYVYRPDIMRHTCLWDFLSYTDKQRIGATNRATHGDNNNNSDSDSDTYVPLTAVNDNVSPCTTSFMHLLHEQCQRAKMLQFKPDHPDAGTHHLRLVSPPRHYILVPSGPAMPRFDRPDSTNAYCHLMLILFKLWVSATDLKRDEETWTFAYNEFIHSNDVIYSHFQIMQNIQFLHTCRDNQDRVMKERLSQHLPSEVIDSAAVKSELVGAPDADDVEELQQRHELLLRDIQRDNSSTNACSLDCLNAITTAGLTDISSSSPAINGMESGICVST
ncbi:hypothetical protein F5887DRAFT_1088616 [Amanita rubescens]|nr:hypothetical protein F5887DRAFT_1088616 [Amanita rubescens]